MKENILEILKEWNIENAEIKQIYDIEKVNHVGSNIEVVSEDTDSVTIKKKEF